MMTARSRSWFSGPVPLELIVLAKAAAHWLATALPMALAAPFLGLLLNLDPNLILPLAVAMLLASLALSLLASLVAAVTVGLKRGGLLLSILTLPLYVPALIFGVAASSGAELMAGSRQSALIIACWRWCCSPWWSRRWRAPRHCGRICAEFHSHRRLA